MSQRVTVSFERDDYATLDDTNVIPLGLTQYEGALAMSALSVLLNRDVWEDMTDAQWDTLSSRISELLDEILSVI